MGFAGLTLSVSAASKVRVWNTGESLALSAEGLFALPASLDRLLMEVLEFFI
jgi:hypothetical protein